MVDILITEDNKEIKKLLSDFLSAEGYSVHAVETGEEALEYFFNNEIRLVLLDIMLPKLDGFEVCRKIREENDTPVIIVSAKSHKEDKLNGLILGADDYIEKPYDIDLLTAKIKGIFKRRYKADIIRDDNIIIDEQKRTVCVNDAELTMTAKEYELLLLFIKNKGKTLQKDWIFNKIWGFDSFSEPQTLTVHIQWLRQKIEKNPKKPEKLITVWGVGYRYE